ncbi:MAG: hypothetical protein MN733_25790, partial [Nitrososphaera sp.]|nr:hypothetical protein [Nitrososphaera sp.]
TLGEFEHLELISILPNSRILVAGSFVYFDEVFQPHIVRLLSNGCVDSQFEGIINETFPSIRSITVQQDGKVLVAGDFRRANSAVDNVWGLARFNEDGSVDSGFSVPYVGDIMQTASLSSGGALIIAHTFQNSPTLLRLRNDGTVDTALFASTNTVSILHIDQNRRTYVVMRAPSITNEITLKVVRLSEDGSVDPTFDPATANAIFADLRSVVQQPNGKLLFAGFSRTQDLTHVIARFGEDGTIDPSFHLILTAVSHFEYWAIKIALIPKSNCLLVGGGFDKIAGRDVPHLAMIDLGDIGLQLPAVLTATGPELLACDAAALRDPIAGSQDRSFTGLEPVDEQLDFFAAVAEAPNGQFVFGGQFTITDNSQFTSRGIARYNSDGTHDPNFQISASDAKAALRGVVRTLLVLDDGSVIAGGDYGITDDRSGGFLAKFQRSGNLDETFARNLRPGSVAGWQTGVQSLLKTTSGGILVGTRYGVEFIRETGEIEKSFTNQVFGQINAIAELPNGRYIVGGELLVSPTLVRLTKNGFPDESFKPDLSNISRVLAIALGPDGRILIGGRASHSRERFGFVRRLWPDGSLDKSFSCLIGPKIDYDGAPFDDRQMDVLQIRILADGKILCSGRFQQVNGFYSPKFARLLPDGALDKTFRSRFPGASTDEAVYDMRVLKDGRILTVGHFWSAMLNGDLAMRNYAVSDEMIRFDYRAPLDRTLVLEAAREIDQLEWSTLEVVLGDDHDHVFKEELHGKPAGFYRLRSQ